MCQEHVSPCARTFSVVPDYPRGRRRRSISPHRLENAAAGFHISPVLFAKGGLEKKGGGAETAAPQIEVRRQADDASVRVRVTPKNLSSGFRFKDLNAIFGI